MSWKTDYLENLFEIMAVDGIENRELLALFEIERRLHATISEMITAFNESERGDDEEDSDFNPMVDRRHLTDLYALAHLDATVSALEQSLLDRFARESGLPDHVVTQIRQKGSARQRL